MIKQKENNLYLKYLILFGLMVMLFFTIAYIPKQFHKHQYTLEELVIDHKVIDNCGKFLCPCGAIKYRRICYDDLEMPILSFFGSMNGISKKK